MIAPELLPLQQLRVGIGEMRKAVLGGEPQQRSRLIGMRKPARRRALAMLEHDQLAALVAAGDQPVGIDESRLVAQHGAAELDRGGRGDRS